MAKSNTVYDGFYSFSLIGKDHQKMVLKCIKDKDIYCINNILDTSNINGNDTGIIAGIGDNEEIKFLVHIDLTNNNNATVNIKSLNHAVPAPALNHAIFLNQLPVKRKFSLSVSHDFGVRVEQQLKNMHLQYQNEQMKKTRNNLAIIKKSTKEY